MSGQLAHRHGRRVHAHPHRGPHRHLLRPSRSHPLASHRTRTPGPAQAQTHSHGLVADSIKRSRKGVRAVLLALGVLAAAAAAQTVVFLASGSVALLADLIHNLGDASTAVPLGIAFALRSARAERWAGLAVVAAIFASACVAGYEAIDRLIYPREVDALGALAAAGLLGFAGNWVAATIRTRAGRRLDSPALIADGAHARADAYVSLAVVASAGALAVGLQAADPLLGLAITLVILRITWQSWQAIRDGPAHSHYARPVAKPQRKALARGVHDRRDTDEGDRPADVVAVRPEAPGPATSAARGPAAARAAFAVTCGHVLQALRALGRTICPVRGAIGTCASCISEMNE